MKATNFLIFIFLLHAFYFAAAAAAAADDLDPVYDHSHEKLLTGVDYYILPFSGGSSSGGITIASTRNKTCPLDVAQELKAYKQGLGVSFHPVNVKKGASGGGVVRVSTDLIIRFSTAKACAPSTIWKVDKYDYLRRRYFITIGGIEGKQGGEFLRGGSFRIEQDKDGYYKVVHCTQVHCVTEPCNPVCNNVGVYHQRGAILLTLADEPLVVLFRKAFKG